MLSLSIVRGLAVASVLGAVSAVGACGGSSTSGTPTVDAGNTGNDAAVTADATGDDSAPLGDDDGGSADAGLVVQQQSPNVYPAMHHPLPQIEKGPGPLLDQMKIINVTFGTDANIATYDAFATAIGSTTWWQKTLTPYGISPGVLSMSVSLTDAISGMTMTQAQVESYLAQQVESGALPPPDAETLYAVYPPQGLTVNVPNGTSTAASCAELDGYHGAFGATVPAQDGGATSVVTAAYAMIFNCGYGGIREIEVTASHEIGEAATDPHPDNGLTYYMHSDDAWSQFYTGLGAGAGGEVADLCVGPSWTESSYYFNKIYSNAAAALSNNPCQPDTSVYFGAAIDTTKEPVNGVLSDGFVTVTPGSTTQVAVNVFSAAALPNELTITVSAVDAMYGQFVSFPSGITATLSQTTAQNGDGLVLTFVVDASATPGETLFVAHASLNASDYNDWPAVLKVK